MRKIILIVLSMIVLTVMSGCTTNEVGTNGKHAVKTSGDAIYPLKSDDSLKVWMGLNPILSTVTTNFADTRLAKELEEKTGVKVQYIHPAQGQEKEQLNLLLASNDLPDVIRADWYSMGGQKSIDSGYIQKLNDSFDKWAPNLTKTLKNNPKLDKMIQTDEGNYYVFPFLREDKSLCVYSGPIVRKDWLDELGLDTPVTIDDWEVMLREFKNKKNADIPFSATSSFYKSGMFVGAFGVNGQFYVEDSYVRFGPIEPGYKEFLILMNKWFNEGLLDRNIVSMDNKILDSNVLNGRTGATFGYAAGSMGKWLGAIAGKSDKFDLIGTCYPVINKGEKPKMTAMDWEYTPNGSYAISQKCKNIELAVRFLDYGYGEEGHMLYNFGIEGVSYEMVDGYPALTDVIKKDPNGETFANMIVQYVMGTYSGPFVQDKRIVEQNQPFAQPKDAVKAWMVSDAEKYNLPLISYNSEENDIRKKYLNAINTYVDEMTLNFITGNEAIQNFDKYVAHVKELGIAEILKVNEAALARYYKR